MLNRNIDDLAAHWDISYFPTFAVLTVAAGNVSVPDQGSTFLLLTLGLLGLVRYQRQLLRRHAQASLTSCSDSRLRYGGQRDRNARARGPVQRVVSALQLY